MLSERLLLDEVLEKYRVRIVDSRRQQRYIHPMKLYAMVDSHGNSLDPTTFMTETLFTIEIAESDLDRMGDHLSSFHQVRNPFDREEIYLREAYIRKKNPAVKKAWENYKMLLKLAAEGKTFD